MGEAGRREMGCSGLARRVAYALFVLQVLRVLILDLKKTLKRI